MRISKSEQYSPMMDINKEQAIIPESKIKEGVDFVFQQNPEIAAVGTRQQYSKYLDSVFPQSIIKEILWHASFEKFENFDKSLIGKNTDQQLINHYGKGFYFSRDNDIDKRWERPFKIPVVVNYVTEDETENNYDAGSYMVIENPSDIHILGTEEDIKSFRQFIDNQKD